MGTICRGLRVHRYAATHTVWRDDASHCVTDVTAGPRRADYTFLHYTFFNRFACARAGAHRAASVQEMAARTHCQSRFTCMSTVPVIAPYLVAFAISTLGCLALIPIVIRIAHRRGLLDVPGERRVHRVAVPRLGGVAIFLATAAAFLAWWWMRSRTVAVPLPFGNVFPGFLLGMTIIFVTGLVDDLRGVSPRWKLIAQVCAAAIVIGSGLKFDSLAIAPASFAFPVSEAVSSALLLLWIVGVTNAFNLIDGIDGLAGSFALVGLVACAVTDVVLHGPSTLPLTLALIGAVGAFLCFNKVPARIFLGDSGSMMLGYFLAVRIVVASTDAQGSLYALVPLAALAFPLADTSIAIARRWLRGHPFSRADGRHIHHQLLALGLSVRQTVEILSLVFGLVTVLGIAITFAPARFTAALLLGSIVALLCIAVYGLRFLRYSEFAELTSSIVSVVRHSRTVVQDKLRASEIAAAIGDATSLDEVRSQLSEFAGSGRIIDIEVIERKQGLHANGPPRQRLSPYDALPLRLDYPFALHGPEGVREFALRIWSERPDGGSHPASERVAARVAPAVEEWFRTHAAELISSKTSRPYLSSETPLRPRGGRSSA